MESSFLIHSAKGTTWSKKDHKWIRKVNGRYYYADEADALENADREHRAVRRYTRNAQREAERSRGSDYGKLYFDKTKRYDALEDNLRDNLPEWKSGYMDGRANVGSRATDAEGKTWKNQTKAAAASHREDEYRAKAEKKIRSRSKGKKIVINLINKFFGD